MHMYIHICIYIYNVSIETLVLFYIHYVYALKTCHLGKRNEYYSPRGGKGSRTRASASAFRGSVTEILQ